MGVFLRDTRGRIDAASVQVLIDGFGVLTHQKVTEPRKLYLAFRRWADRELASPYRARVFLLIAFSPFILASYFRAPTAWILMIGWAVLWIGFACWRGFRLMRTMAIRGDRSFDRKGKYDLPAEYARSESVLNARLRVRRSRKRKAL